MEKQNASGCIAPCRYVLLNVEARGARDLCGFWQGFYTLRRRLMIVHVGAQEGSDAPVPEMLLDDCTDRIKQILDQNSFGPESIQTKEPTNGFEPESIWIGPESFWTSVRFGAESLSSARAAVECTLGRPSG